jgi:hypothetical protein
MCQDAAKVRILTKTMELAMAVARKVKPGCFVVLFYALVAVYFSVVIRFS